MPRKTTEFISSQLNLFASSVLGHGVISNPDHLQEKGVLSLFVALAVGNIFLYVINLNTFFKRETDNSV